MNEKGFRPNTNSVTHNNATVISFPNDLVNNNNTFLTFNYYYQI